MFNLKTSSKAFFLIALSMSVFFTSCLTVNQKKIVEAPYVPEVQEEVKVEKEREFLVYLSQTDVPQIDGRFNEWNGLSGVHSRQMVYGGSFSPKNADGFFVCRTDGTNFYIYAEVTDDDANPNTYEASQAWRGDSVEFFFGTDTSRHSSFKNSDTRIRIIPRSRSNMYDAVLAINDTETKNTDVKIACVYSDGGYKIEAKIPLSLLGTSTLRKNQKLRADFQVNDADGGKERSGLMHWNSPDDNTYSDPSSWGNGKVVELAK